MQDKNIYCNKQQLNISQSKHNNSISLVLFAPTNKTVYLNTLYLILKNQGKWSKTENSWSARTIKEGYKDKI